MGQGIVCEEFVDTNWFIGLSERSEPWTAAQIKWILCIYLIIYFCKNGWKKTEYGADCYASLLLTLWITVQ